MKKLIWMILALALPLTGCVRQPASPSPTWLKRGESPGRVEVTLAFNRRDGIAANQYAVWIENEAGDIVRTLYATRYTAQGGWKSRPDSLPVWVGKSGLEQGASADACSGPTPASGRQTYVWDCRDETGQAVAAGDYRFFVEGTIFWQDGVVFSGVIAVKGEANSARAQPQYTTAEAAQSDMIADVEAAYTP